MRKDRVTWFVSLTRSNYTTNKGKVYPQAILRGTLNVEDVVNSIVARGSELRRETLLAIAHQIEESIMDYLVDGFAVTGALGTLTPTVTGEWSYDRIDPSARAQNEATLRYTISKEIKERFANPLFQNQGMRNSRLCISSLSNMEYEGADCIVSPGNTVLVKGNLLLMNGEDPSRGFYFIDPETQEVAGFIPAGKIYGSTRSLVHFKIPEDLPFGTYFLKVVSQCNTNPRPLQKPNSFVWKKRIEVMAPDLAEEAVRRLREEGDQGDERLEV